VAAPHGKFRPSARLDAYAAAPAGRHTPKNIMEASENAGLSLEGRDGTALQRIDLNRVTETLASSKDSAGFSRLELMLTAVLPRLVGDGSKTQSGG
jgi:hypothetical protein